MRLLVDEDTASATLITRLLAAEHEVVQLLHGTPDEVVFNEAQRLTLPILTANVGRKGRRDPGGLYQFAIVTTLPAAPWPPGGQRCQSPR